ncbi:MAG: cysteine desulfurase family protein [Planctomycetota bacterium]|nr:cysteine desulfurase family protein [Planctomycetota bacterium]
MPLDRVYLDHAAMTPLSAAARKAMLPLLDPLYANASSPHLEGRAAKDALEDARSQVAGTLGCRPREVIFTAGATEAATIALHGAARMMARAGRTRIVLSAVEYPSVLDTAALLGTQGFDVVVVPVDAEGRVDADAFLEAAGDDAACAALMLANHETGTRMPVSNVTSALRERRIPIICDAALAPGRLPLDIAELGADLVLLSGVKAGGPAGSGALIVRRGTRLEPFLMGGVQEERLRPGTENVAACAGFAAALEEACGDQAERATRYAGLIDHFVDGLGGLEGWTRVGSATHALPGLVTLEVEHAEGEAVMINMDLEGFAISTGSSCALGSRDPSPGLLAMGFTKQRAASTIRVSVGEGNDRDHMERAASTLCAIVSRLRSLANR